MHVAFVNHTTVPNGASTVLKSLFSIFKKSIAFNSSQLISFDLGGFLSFDENSSSSTFKSASQSNSFLQLLIRDLATTPINIFLILVTLWSKFIFQNGHILLYWNTLTRLWYIPFLSIFSPPSTKIICHCHEAPIFFRKRSRFSFLYRFYSRFIDLTICVSKDTKSELVNFCFDPARINIIHNPVSIPGFTFPSPSLSIEVPPKILFIAGTLTRRKGFDIFIEAIKSLHAFDIYPEVLIIGNPTSFSTRLIKDLDICSKNISQFLPVKLSKLKDFSIDLAVFPSRSEAQPLLPLELATTFCPLILSDIPAHLSLFNESQALFFKQEQPASLALTIMNLLASPRSKIISMLNHSNRHVLTEFTEEKAYSKILSSISSLSILQS